MKSFKQRLLESQREFHYRIKTVVELNDTRLEDMERLLSRYKLIHMGHVQKVDGELNSLEFTDVENADISFVDFVIGVPVSAYIIQQEMRAALNVPEKFLVVRADAEAQEVEGARIQLLQTLDKVSTSDGFTKPGSLLSTDPEYLDAEQPMYTQVYGDQYNKKFLNLLSKVASTRSSDQIYPHADLISPEQRATHAKLFNAHVPDFNAAHDTPKPVYKNKFEDLPEPVNPTFVSAAGALDDNTRSYFKVKQNNLGKTKVYQDQTKPVRGKTS
jgi:hypothetical protein